MNNIELNQPTQKFINWTDEMPFFVISDILNARRRDDHPWMRCGLCGHTFEAGDWAR